MMSTNNYTEIINRPKWFMGLPEYEIRAPKTEVNYKASFYTHVFPYRSSVHSPQGDSEQYILFNAFNQSTYLIDKSLVAAVEEVLQKHTFDYRTIDPALFQLLYHGRFIIPARFDEKKLMRDRIQQGRSRKDLLYLTIAPTMGCNFNCTYCIEDDSFRKDFTVMFPEVEDRIVELVKNHIDRDGIKRVSIAWFGGEPLLEIGTMDRIMQRVQTICKAHNVKFDCNVTTNGYLLNEKAVDILAQYNPDFIKVSLDGPAAVHDTRRVLLNKKPTYGKILKNIIQAAEKLRIWVRVNVDRANCDSVIALLDDLQAHMKVNSRISIYLGIVEDHEFMTGKLKSHLGRAEFAEIDKKITIEAVKRKLAKWHLPSMIGNFCGADLELGSMIGPRGELYACWAEFGNPEKVIGYLGDGKLVNEDHLKQYTEFDVTTHEKCASCKVMPLCTGGCSRERLFHKEPQCGVYKFNLEDRISEYVSELEKLYKAEKVADDS
jgi:uncharacterized protein